MTESKDLYGGECSDGSPAGFADQLSSNPRAMAMCWLTEASITERSFVASQFVEPTKRNIVHNRFTTRKIRSQIYRKVGRVVGQVGAWAEDRIHVPPDSNTNKCLLSEDRILKQLSAIDPSCSSRQVAMMREYDTVQS